jgi:4-amino-4-deoxy-L-arabinose transferase-like glycosyltransferase
MPLVEIIQNLIHKLEVGAGPRFFRIAALLLAVVALAMRYDFHAYRNLTAPEGMDAAQLARNISEGKGYTTLFIRPLSIYLVQRHSEAGTPLALTNASFDFAHLKTAHPDLANPPVYPVLLAGLMKVLPFHYAVDLKSSFWADNGRFGRYQPDFLIAMFNQILLVAAIVLTFFLARKLFDAGVAWLSAILMIGCELLWRFSVSGLSTMLLLVIFLGLTWCILKIEEIAREPQPRAHWLLGLAVMAGVLTGVGALTRYAFGWTIIPVVAFLVLFSGQKKALHALAALGTFILVLTPWVVRNFAVSGTPFGTASFAVAGTTLLFPQFQLERAIHPDLGHVLWLSPYLHKLVTKGQSILTNDLTRFGGSWATLLFWAGLLLSFRSVAVRRMRYFLLFCLGTFIVVQALGQTQLSVESPEVNSENLLVLLAPLVFLYGVSLFLTLLEQMNLPALQLRYPIIAAFAALSCLPMIFVMLPPKTSPVAYPPYFPPDIQQTAVWMKENELMMSDVPWAVAWYGQRQCVWLTLNAQDDFNAINYWMKPVQALYLTPETMDSRFVSDWVRTRDYSWGSFILQVVTQNQIPPSFPLRIAPKGFLPERLFLTDRERWKLAPQ